jgi:hypothetical protein
MGETELIGIIRDANAQYAVLFGQIMTLNFAMIVAIYYFLHRAHILFRGAAFGFYAIGMLALNGLMLQQATYKFQALTVLAGLPAGHRSKMGDYVLLLNQSWLKQFTSVFLSVGIWILFVGIAYLLFWWRGDPERRSKG